MSAHAVAAEKTGFHRIWGLDVLRAIASIFVVLHHYLDWAGQLQWGSPIQFIWTGMELFFVLSGYLIAGQLFSKIKKNESNFIWRFYARRFCRTLPCYFLILFIYIVFVDGNSRELWKYFLFIQNFGIPLHFVHSWSLCIEEQFYVFLPLLIFLLLKLKVLLKRFPRLFDPIFFASLIMICGAIVRYLIWSKARPDLVFRANSDQGVWLYYSEFYFPTYIRLDSLSVGVCLAAIRVKQPEKWARWINSPHRFLLMGLTLIYFAFLAFHSAMGMMAMLIGYPLLATGYGAILISSLNKESLLCKWKIPGFSQIVLLSYSMYLTHGLALILAVSLTKKYSLPVGGLSMATMSVFLILLFSATLYFLLERPCLQIRDRYFT